MIEHTVPRDGVSHCCCNMKLHILVNIGAGLYLNQYWLVIDWTPDSKIHGANVGPTWGRQDPGGPHVGHMNLAIWDL